MAKGQPGKRDGWKKAGLVGLGTVLGILLSLNFSAIAQREAKTPIPYEDLQLLSAVFGKIKSDYVETVPDDKLIKEAINGMVRGPRPALRFPRRRGVQGAAGLARRASSAASASKSASRTASSGSPRRSRTRPPTAPASSPAT